MQKLPNIVLYHADCYDGFGAAWAIEQARRLAGLDYDTIRYVPVQYNKPLPEEDYSCALLYIVDFSLPVDQLQRLTLVADKIVILDHHKSAQENLADVQKIYLGQDPMELPYDVLAHFDMEQSGAVLTWKHFHTAPVPKMLEYIQDRDIWKWALPNSEQINSAISTTPFSFRAFDRLADDLEHNFDDVHTVGVAVLRYRAKLVEEICKSARMTSYTMHGSTKPIPCVAVRSPVLQSEVGHYLCRKFPEAKFAIIYSDIPGDPANIKWSLRSEGDFDITEIAKRYGGGGHRNAGGMTTPTWRMV